MKTLNERIVNLDNRDYHMHSSSFSDWIPTINEIAQFAGTIWLKEIAITDHSQIAIDILKEKNNIPCWSPADFSVKRWKNGYIDVNVFFWVDWDLLDEDGNVCFDIQWIEPEFVILSAHRDVFKWNVENITKATIKAIKKYHKRIKFIAHPCNNSDFWEYYNIEKLVEVANKYWIALEFNAKNFVRWKTNLEKLDYLLKNTDRIYLNSDAHTLYELKTVREKAINFLKEKKYL
jgi:histidinol phosphatase-like PHP family hydrolase